MRNNENCRSVKTAPIVIKGGHWCDGLIPQLEVDGCWLDVRQCAARGIALKEQRRVEADRVTMHLELVNSGAGFRCGGFRWRYRTGNRNDFLGLPGSRLHLYLEGWSMPSGCGARRPGDRDFRLNPDYVRYAVCRPESYKPETENCFRAEHLIEVNDSERGACLVIGFLTAARMFGRFELQLGSGGLEKLDIIADCDDRPVDTGETLRSETLCFLPGTDGYEALETFADRWGEAMHARHSSDIPTGWCSWYYYYDRVSEKDIMENLLFLCANRDSYPLEYIQLDDGYQEALGDWLSWNEKFPGGCRYFSSEVRKAGFKPALWLAPFLVEEKSAFFREHPDWLVRTRTGEIDLSFTWRENSRVAVLDGTKPEVQSYLTELFRNLRQSGIEYVKLDFLVHGAIPGRRYDRKATRCEALRRGMEAIRRGFGDGFILGCTAPLGCMVGLVDGMRIAPDITPGWAAGERFDEAPSLPNVCRNGINRVYMHHRLWLNDPDTHIARSDNNLMTENEVILWSCALKLLGGMLLLSDRFETLIPERAALCRWLLEKRDEYAVRPLDSFTSPIPSVWRAVSRRDGKTLLAFFNFSDTARKFQVKEEQLEPFRFPLSEKTLMKNGLLAPHSCCIFQCSAGM